MKYLRICILLKSISILSIYSQPQIINIETNNISLVLAGEKGKRLDFLYWGNKFSEKDLSGFQVLFDKKQMRQQAYPAFGDDFLFNPALRIIHADGTLTTSLVYDGYQVNTIDKNRAELNIALKDQLYPVFVNLKFVSYRNEDIITQRVSIHHKEKGIMKINEISSAYFPIKAYSYYLTQLAGPWGAEANLIEEKLLPGTKLIDSKKGVRTAHGHTPTFLLSVNGPATEHEGQIYAGALAWSGNYNLSFQVDDKNLLHINCGINSFASTYNLEPDKTFDTPEIVLSYSNQGKGQISRNFHNWTRKYNLFHGDQLRPIVLNSWEGVYFDFDEEKITAMIDDAANLGVELFVLDDGWFGNKYPRDNEKAGLGDWQVNKNKLPRGLDYLARYTVEKRLQFGIWIEPEMVNPQSELAKKHPEWIVKSGDRPIQQSRNQWILDLSNSEVQDFVFNIFDDILSLSKHISYVKWDANRHVQNVGSTYLSKENQSHFWVDYIHGLYNVYQRIRNKYPDITIQACSSGGGRIDFGSLKFHDEFWTSDNTNALDRIYIQYGINTFYPSIATASHVSANLNHQTGMQIPLKFRFDTAMTGRLGLELQPNQLSQEELTFAKSAVSTYKEIRPIIQFGELFRLVSPYENNGEWSSHMYVSKDKKKAVLFAYCLKFHTYEKFATRLYGLDPDRQYKITEINKSQNRSKFHGDGISFTGKFLLNNSIEINITKPYESVILVLEEV